MSLKHVAYSINFFFCSELPRMKIDCISVLKSIRLWFCCKRENHIINTCLNILYTMWFAMGQSIRCKRIYPCMWCRPLGTKAPSIKKTEVLSRLQCAIYTCKFKLTAKNPFDWVQNNLFILYKGLFPLGINVQDHLRVFPFFLKELETIAPALVP